MPVEVYGQAKPASPRRALGASVALLLLAALLAAAMTRARGGDPLGPRVRPEGWLASFRAPRRFQGEDYGLRDIGLPYIVHGKTRAGSLATLAVYRVDGPSFRSATALCDSVIRAHLGFPRGLWPTRRLTRLDRKLGPEPAAEIIDSNAGGVVRAVVLPGGEAYAVWLGVEGPAIDRSTFRLFDLTCQSFEFQTAP